MTTTPERRAGCRLPLLSIMALLAVAGLVFGFSLEAVLDRGCIASCERLAFTLLFAAAPTSALFTALGGELVVAYPVDLIAWIVLGLWHAGLASRARRVARAWWGWMAVFLTTALAYGALLSPLVERA